MTAEVGGTPEFSQSPELPVKICEVLKVAC